MLLLLLFHSPRAFISRGDRNVYRRKSDPLIRNALKPKSRSKLSLKICLGPGAARHARVWLSLEARMDVVGARNDLSPSLLHDCDRSNLGPVHHAYSSSDRTLFSSGISGVVISGVVPSTLIGSPLVPSIHRRVFSQSSRFAVHVPRVGFVCPLPCKVSIVLLLKLTFVSL